MGTTGTHVRPRWPVAVFAASVVAGLVFAAAHLTADGSDLRPAGGDVGSLVAERARRVELQRVDARGLQGSIDALSRDAASGTVLKKLLATVSGLEDVAGLTTVKGAGVVVTLDDAPRTVEVPDGDDPNVLVVHQQDIQAFVNALWAGGARAITIHGQRLVSTTGIKCVGSTVVLDGVPYSPPYDIAAVGDPLELQAALNTSSEVSTFRDYVDRYQLGLDLEVKDSITAKPYAGSVGLRHAVAVTP
ncbi:hypothetical protein ASD11_15490 [Aeromicrobium sp. Root495]|uniref:DUF881 domain-containing protein n=1 Tax=Aeromicrobium sp. Root495 TaxID=1736550 RepID=UPI0006FCA1AD|nr:DUF881 domain-containing protein [Aeromicrobium sp. Root495]KQY55896.1 hypothetical protein ASD11_15490 [Aeromicrobium sp. Root495]